MRVRVDLRRSPFSTLSHSLGRSALCTCGVDAVGYTTGCKRQRQTWQWKQHFPRPPLEWAPCVRAMGDEVVTCTDKLPGTSGACLARTDDSNPAVSLQTVATYVRDQRGGWPVSTSCPTGRAGHYQGTDGDVLLATARGYLTC